uniref:Uncharacterized protein n=1 Tax=Arundo donax TaxID=35708 RepID=A0A0A9H648_ARUDO
MYPHTKITQSIIYIANNDETTEA